MLTRCTPSMYVQENIYQDERPFVSAKKVMYDMGEPYSSQLELLSFHTVSKVMAGRGKSVPVGAGVDVGVGVSADVGVGVYRKFV